MSLWMSQLRAWARASSPLHTFSFHTITDNLSYVRLRHLVSKKPDLLKEATIQVLNILQREVSHSQDYGDAEVLLPMLHLFRELLIMVSQV